MGGSPSCVWGMGLTTPHRKRLPITKR